MKKGDFVLISAQYLAKTEGFTTKGGKKKWYRVVVSKVNKNSFEFTSDDMRYIHICNFKNTDLYKEITNESNNDEH